MAFTKFLKCMHQAFCTSDTVAQGNQCDQICSRAKNSTKTRIISGNTNKKATTHQSTIILHLRLFISSEISGACDHPSAYCKDDERIFLATPIRRTWATSKLTIPERLKTDKSKRANILDLTTMFPSLRKYKSIELITATIQEIVRTDRINRSMRLRISCSILCPTINAIPIDMTARTDERESFWVWRSPGKSTNVMNSMNSSVEAIAKAG